MRSYDENNLHVAVDYMARPTSSNTSTVSRSVNFGKLVRNINYDQILGYGSASHGMGNVVIIEHLLNNGEKWLSLHAHLASKNLDEIEINDFITKEQNIGIVGCSGSTELQWCSSTGSNRHNHFELKRPGFEEMDLWSFGYLNQTEANSLRADGETEDKSITDTIQQNFSTISNFQMNNKEVVLPYISKTSTPTSSNYDVYGIANKTIYGSLDLTGTFHRSSIVVRDFFTRSQIGSKGNLPDSQRFIGGLNENIAVSGITGDNTYQAGDYLFAVYLVKDENNNNNIDIGETSYGYPVKFSFVKDGDIIIDNDQMNADEDPNNDLENEPAYNASVGAKVPGYFLTADLHQGRSEKFAQWKPYQSGKYEIYVHIPEYGATATSVSYVIKKDGTEELQVFSQDINQSDNAGDWVKLKTNTENTFNFSEAGYVGLYLGANEGESNYEVLADQKVAFDAIKFVKPSFNMTPILLYLLDESETVINNAKLMKISWFINGNKKEIIPQGFSGKVLRLFTWWGDRSIKLDINNNNNFEYDYNENYPSQDVWTNDDVNLSFDNGFSIQDYELWTNYWIDDTHGEVNCWASDCRYNPYGAGALMLLDDEKFSCINNIWNYNGSPVNGEDLYCREFEIQDETKEYFNLQ